MRRVEEIKKLIAHGDRAWDVVIIGGGATGLGVAVDAASRGLSTLLMERADFTSGTSSKSTKLVHGGVRYLAQGDVSLVLEALHERGLLARNAPHVVRDLGFVIPCYQSFDKYFYGAGLKIYDLLAGRLGFSRSRLLNKTKVSDYLPNIKSNNLRGGVLYHDGQFDDSRLAINLAQTAINHGACVLNYVNVHELHKDHLGRINGVGFEDLESGVSERVNARCVINATGVFVDDVLRLDHGGTKKLITASQGSHLVVDRKFLAGNNALMIPKTTDGRVLFAVPWHHHLVIGTTDVAVGDPTTSPRPSDDELRFILNNANQYLNQEIKVSDIRSVFAGQRPLAASSRDNRTGATKEISRSHKIVRSSSGLISVIGGKWTTYRRMAVDTLQSARSILGDIGRSKTESLVIHGATQNKYEDFDHHPLAVYGTDRQRITTLIDQDQTLAKSIHPDIDISFAQVIFAFRHEMAMTVEDVLARRTRTLFLNARAALESAETVTAIAAKELKRDLNWQRSQIESFKKYASSFLPPQSL